MQNGVLHVLLMLITHEGFQVTLPFVCHVIPYKPPPWRPSPWQFLPLALQAAGQGNELYGGGGGYKVSVDI